MSIGSCKIFALFILLIFLAKMVVSLYFFPMMKKDTIFGILAGFLLFFFCWQPSAAASPHVFVSTRYQFVFDAEGLKGVYACWTFDEIYSAATGAEFDYDKDGRFNEKESGKLIRLGSQSLPDLDFFTHISIDGKPYPVKSVSDFSITFEKGILAYRFFISCPLKIDDMKHRVKISPYDTEFFLVMFFADNDPVMFENSDAYQIQTDIGDDPASLISFDMVHPAALTLEIQRKL